MAFGLLRSLSLQLNQRLQWLPRNVEARTKSSKDIVQSDKQGEREHNLRIGLLLPHLVNATALLDRTNCGCISSQSRDAQTGMTQSGVLVSRALPCYLPFVLLSQQWGSAVYLMPITQETESPTPATNNADPSLCDDRTFLHGTPFSNVIEVSERPLKPFPVHKYVASGFRLASLTKNSRNWLWQRWAPRQKTKFQSSQQSCKSW